MSYYRVKVGGAEEAHNLRNSPLPCTACPPSSFNQISNRRVHSGQRLRRPSVFRAPRLAWAPVFSKTALSLSTLSAHSGSKRQSTLPRLRPRMAERARSVLLQLTSWPWRFDRSVGLAALAPAVIQHSKVVPSIFAGALGDHAGVSALGNLPFVSPT